MELNLDDLKNRLTDYVQSITKPSQGKQYNCPLCGSGTHEHKTGAFSIFDEGKKWKCHACGEGGDIYDLCAKVEKCDLREAAKKIGNLYGDGSMTYHDLQHHGNSREDQASPTGSFLQDIERFAAAMEGSPAQPYLEGRGLTLETVRRFKLGYDAERNCVTIPYNNEGTYYIRRSIDPHGDKSPHGKLPGIKVPLFNQEALYNSDAVFIVESPLCAISIEQAGGAAVALSGVDGGPLLNALKQNPTNAALLFCLDNDDSGRNASKDLLEKCTDAGYFAIDETLFIMGPETDKKDGNYRKDPNDVLQQNGPEDLRSAIKLAAESAINIHKSLIQEKEEERRTRTGPEMVDSFLEAIQTRRYEPVPTGISDIDEALGGGLFRQNIVLLGAAPGVGKTALAQFIFEGMAKRGISCVYLNLEMSREQVIARSFSRIVAQHGKKIHALEILQGYKWTDEQRKTILEAAEEYKATIAPQMIYNPDGVTTDLDKILTYIETEAQNAEAQQKAAPFVVLDYLQIVTGQPREDAAAIIKRAMASLKSYAVRYKSMVFVIMAHNRASNSNGSVSMESGRDTSAIEYSADVQLGLAYTRCLKRRGNEPQKSPDELTKEERKNVTLIITKSRFTGDARQVDLRFDGETMSYSQIAKNADESYAMNQYAAKRW